MRCSAGVGVQRGRLSDSSYTASAALALIAPTQVGCVDLD